MNYPAASCGKSRIHNTEFRSQEENIDVERRETMTRKIVVEFSDAHIKVTATLQDKQEPEMCEAFWKVLNKPLKLACYHTLSTGQFFGGEGRPPRHPVKTGTQAVPIGRKSLLLCQLDPGMIVYGGGHSIKVAYGPDITEPLPAPGPVVAKVDKEYLDDFLQGGLSVWNAQYVTHQLTTMTIRRKEA